jgi:hypothetical protein
MASRLVNYAFVWRSSAFDRRSLALPLYMHSPESELVESSVKGETYQVRRRFLVQIRKSSSPVPIDTPQIRVF